MTREEQIIEASQLYAKHQQKPFMDGALWADQNPINYDGKAMIHVLNKGAAIGRREMLDKATRWLLDEMFVEDVEGEPYVMSATASSIEEFIGNFKQAMEEQ